MERSPSAFVQECLPLLPGGQALDVAAGTGRHALYLASHGLTVHAIDQSADALEAIKPAARTLEQQAISIQVIDLETDPLRPPELGNSNYDVVLVTLYLYRPLFPNLIKAIRPGGLLLYETFLVENYDRYKRPRGRHFCLESKELLRLTDGLEVLRYEEGERTGGRPGNSAITARLLARKMN